MSAALFLLIVSAVAAECPKDWAKCRDACFQAIPSQCFISLTSTQLAEIDPSQIKLLSPEQIKQFQPSLFPSLSSAQVSALNIDSCKALSPDQMARFGDTVSSACGSISDQCLQNIQANSLTLLSLHCARALPNLAAFKPEQISSLSDKVVEFWSGKQLKTLGSCKGFKKSQMSVMGSQSPYDQCSSLSNQCIETLSDDALSGLNGLCFGSLRDLSHLGPQLSQIPADSFSKLLMAQITTLSPAGCSGLTSLQMQSVATKSPYDACQGFSAECLAAIPDEVFAGIGINCARKLSLAGTKHTQIAMIDPGTIGFITKTSWESIPNDACKGLTGPQLAEMGSQSPYDACAGLSASCLGHVNPSALSKLGRPCASGLRDLSQMNSSHVANLNLEVASFITRSATHSMATNGCSGLNSDLLGTWGSASPYDACQGFSAECLGAVPHEAYMGISGLCARNLASLSKLNSVQIAAISIQGCESLRKESLATLNPSVCAGFTPLQLASLGSSSPYTACEGLGSQCVGFLQSQSLSSISAQCVFKLGDVSLWNSDQLSHVSLNAVSSFRASTLLTLNPDVCHGFTVDQLSRLSVTSCQGLSIPCLSNIDKMTPKSFLGFHGACVASFDVALFNDLSEESVFHFTNDGISGFSSTVFTTLWRRFGRTLADRYTVSQLSRVSSRVMNRFQDSYNSLFRGQEYFELCPRDSFRDVHWLHVMFSKDNSVGCVRFNTLPLELWGALRKEHAPNLVSDTFHDLVRPQVSELSEGFVSGITATQVVFIPCSSFSSLELSAFSKDGVLQRITPKQISAFVRSHQVLLTPESCSNWISYLGDQQRAKLKIDVSSCDKNAKASTVTFSDVDREDCSATPGPDSPSSSSSDKSLGAGAITGIVLAVLATVSVAGFLAFRLWRARSAQGHSPLL